MLASPSLVIVFYLFISANGEVVKEGEYEVFHSEAWEKENSFEDAQNKAVEEFQTREANEKRGLLLGVSIAASLANIGLDVFFGNGGCCLVHRASYADACDKVENVKRIRERIQAKSNLILQKELEADTTYNWISSIDSNNMNIKNEVDRIKTLLVDLIEAMDPEAKNRYAAKANEIAQFADRNKEVVDKWTNVELDIQYEPLYKTTLGKVQLLAGLTTDLGEILMKKIMKEFQIRKINKELSPTIRNKLMLNTEIKVKGKAKHLFKGARLQDEARLKKLIVKSELKKQKLKTAKTTRTKITNGLAKGFRFIGIGFEAVAIGLKVKQCIDVMKQVNQKEIDIIADEARVDSVIRAIDANLAEINTGYGEVRTALKSDNFLALIEDFRTLIKESSRSLQDQSAQEAYTDLGVFIQFIGTANPSLTDTLQKKLIAGLEKIDFKYTCLERKYNMVRKISNGCQRGYDSLQKLYEDAAKEEKIIQKCKNEAGVVYTTYDQVAEIIVRKESKEGNYYPNCLLNNNATMTSKCTQTKCLDNPYQSSATAQVSAQDLEKVCSTFVCRSIPLSGREQQNVCFYKANIPGANVNMIMRFLPKNKSRAEVAQAFAACP